MTKAQVMKFQRICKSLPLGYRIDTGAQGVEENCYYIVGPDGQRVIETQRLDMLDRAVQTLSANVMSAEVLAINPVLGKLEKG